MTDGGERRVAGLPHGTSARWIHAVLQEAGDRITCRGRVPPGPFRRDGRCPSFALLELAAQSAALLELPVGEVGSGDRGSGVGYVVRVRRVRLGAPDVPAGAELVAEVERIGAAPPLYQYDFRVGIEHGETVARGTLVIYVPDA